MPIWLLNGFLIASVLIIVSFGFLALRRNS